DLVVANHADGRVALLAGGPDGLSLEEVNDSLALSNPTGLALGSVQNNGLDVYAATEGAEAPVLLVFSLGASSSQSSGSPGLTLLPLEQSSLPLIATLLNPYIDLNGANAESNGAQEATAVALVLSNTLTISLGQSISGNSVEHELEEIEGDVASAYDA